MNKNQFKVLSPMIASAARTLSSVIGNACGLDV
jgi:hypothetical protein